jgi:hypothetical protein
MASSSVILATYFIMMGEFIPFGHWLKNALWQLSFVALIISFPTSLAAFFLSRVQTEEPSSHVALGVKASLLVSSFYVAFIILLFIFSPLMRK